MPESRPAPSDLAGGGRGATFWETVSEGYELRPDEVELLAEACRLLDLVDSLRQVVADDGLTSTGSKGQVTTNPALVELRQVRQQLRLHLNALALPDPDTDATAASRRGRQAAAARWARRGT